jgi:hypothetical protein
MAKVVDFFSMPLFVKNEIKVCLNSSCAKLSHNAGMLAVTFPLSRIVDYTLFFALQEVVHNPLLPAGMLS